MAKIQLFEPYCCHRSNNVNNRANTSITKFVFKKVPRHEFTQLILKRNIEKSSQDNEYSYLSHRIQQEHVRRCLYDIQSHVGQNQKKKFSNDMHLGKYICIPNDRPTSPWKKS